MMKLWGILLSGMLAVSSIENADIVPGGFVYLQGIEKVSQNYIRRI